MLGLLVSSAVSAKDDSQSLDPWPGLMKRLQERQEERQRLSKSTNHSLLYNSARKLYESADYDQAQIVIERAIKLQSKAPEYHELLTQILIKRKNYPSALSSANKLIALSPKDPYAYCLRARVHSSLKDRNSAVVDASQAAKIAPNDRKILFLLANNQFSVGKYNDAITTLNHLIELNKNMADAFQLRAMCYKFAGKDKESAADLKMAERLQGE